ncbi:MAG: RAD55 family ATPase [Promethearchaeota archaeon]|jgi:KaiC/GvpD/RAD55 family RecA-like ATPase
MNKKSLTELIPIGIPVIDEYIVGLPSDAVILIIGDPGSGFITFLHQLLVIRGKTGIPAIYTSLDKPRNEIQNNFARFGWNIADVSWQFNDLSPTTKQRESSSLKWDSDAVNVVSHDLFRKITEYKENPSIPIFDTCINTLTFMLIQSSPKSVLRFINEYAGEVKGTGGWHFVTMVRGVHSIEIENLFSHYCDVVLEFAMTLNTETRLYERVLGIKKLPGVDSRVFPIEYDKTGIRPITTSKIQ